MSDSLRHDTPPSSTGDSAADRDTKIDELLLQGLDHYFNAEYEQAVDVWTRVLFFDRGHARARAYIERARGAIAERQRESEELLHTGVAAFQRGEIETARQLLESVVERSGPQEVAVSFLQRLDRLDAVLPQTGRPARTRALRRGRRTDVTPDKQTSAGSRRVRILPIILFAGVVAAVGYAAILYGVASRDRLESLLLLRPAERAPAVTHAPDDPLPVPHTAELAIARARVLFDRGRLYEALRALDGVRPGDSLKSEADVLRTAIQVALLSGVDSRASVVTSGRAPAGR